MKQSMGTNSRVLGLFPRGASKYSWSMLFNTWITWALNVMVFTMIYTLGANIIEEFNLSPIAWGYVVISYLMVRVLCDFPLTWLSDKLGKGWRRKYVWCVVMVEYVVVGALIAVPALSSSLTGFVLLLLGIALGTTASEALGVITSVEWWPNEERGFAVGLHHTGYPVGALIGGVVASWTLSIVGPDSWRIVYLASLLTLPFILWYWAISTPSHYEEVAENTRKRGLTWLWDEVKNNDAEAKQSLFKAIFQKDVIIALICIFVFQGLYNVFATTYPAYLKFVGGYSFAQVASLAVVWAFTGALFQFLLPTLSDRFGRKWFVIGAALTQAVVFLCLPIATSLLGVVLVQLLYGVTLNAVFPLLFSTVADVAGKHVGAVLGASFTAMWLGAVCGTALATFVLERGGGFSSASAYHNVYFLVAAIVLAIGILRAFGRETNKRPRPVRQPKDEKIDA